MSILSDIAKRIKGGSCERLVRQTGNEVTIAGGSFGVGNFKIDIANYSNKIKEFYQVTQVMVALDNSQYLLCSTISGMKGNDQLKEDCTRIRLQLILAFSQLQAILSLPKPDGELGKELARWIRYMSRLNEQSISLLKPGPRMISKGNRSELVQVMKYQGIDEEQIQNAINITR